MTVPTWRLMRVGLLAALTLACGRKGGGEDEAAKANAPAVVGARTAIATVQPFTETVGAIGAVQPRAGHVASLSAPSPTRVAHVYVATGQHVAAGETLVQLEQAGFEASAQSAAAAVAAAERTYEREDRLAREGIVPRKDVDQAAAELAKARADLVAAKRASELSVLRSPIAGVVTRMSAVLGASVDANQPLVEVADPSAMDIVLGVTASEAARVRPGAKVTLSAGASAGGEPLGIGTVVDVAGTVDTASRSVAVRVQAPATRRPLRIGETVFGQIAVSMHASAIVVPIEALVPEGEAFKVFVVDASGTARARAVTVGGRTDQLAEITSGLKAGERVVTYGAYGVEDSAKVLPPDQSTHAPAPAAKP